MKKTTLFFAMSLAMVGAAFSQQTNPLLNRKPSEDSNNAQSNSAKILSWQEFKNATLEGGEFKDPIDVNINGVIDPIKSNGTCKANSGNILVDFIPKIAIAPPAVKKGMPFKYPDLCFQVDNKIYKGGSGPVSVVTLKGSVEQGYTIIQFVSKTNNTGKSKTGN